MFLDENLKNLNIPISYENMIKEMNIKNESYYGKHPDLLKCEEYLKEIKNQLMIGKNPNKCSELRTMERTLASLFGFENFHITFIADGGDYLDAFTVPYFYQQNKSELDKFFQLVKTGGGIKYANPKGKVLYTYGSTYMLRNYTPETIMSLFLHEIGHNFFLVKENIHNVKAKSASDAIIYLMEVLKYYNWDPMLYPDVIKSMLDLSIFNKDPQKYMNELQKKFSTDKAILNDIERYNTEQKKSLNNTIKKLLYVGKKMFGLVFSIPFNFIKLLFLPLLLMSARTEKDILHDKNLKTQEFNNEKFSDNFAITYGYGVGIVETFANVENASKKMKLNSKIPIVRINQYLSMTYKTFVKYFADEHPDDLSRCKFVLDKLKYELKNAKDLDPRQVQEIKDDIARIERLLKDRPYFKKGIDAMFKNIMNERNEVGSVGMSNEEIYDFDKTIISNKIKNESVKSVADKLKDFNEYEKQFMNQTILTENALIILDKLENNPEEVINEIVNDTLAQ